MKTFYDILKIKVDATDDEIIEAYNKLEKKYKNDEEKLKNIQIAKKILTNKEARQNYDQKINEMLQNQLISNIKENTNKFNNQKEKEEQNKKIKQENLKNKENRNEPILEKQEETKVEKPIKQIKQEKDKLKHKEKKEQKRLKKQEKIREKQYEEAYTKYLESLGFKVKKKWTFKRIKRWFISILLIVLICFIIWSIPEFRNKLINLYENNFLIKLCVDLIVSIVKIIFDMIKSILKVGE